MDSDQNENISTEAFIEMAISWDPDKWSVECPRLSPAQLTLLVPLASPENGPSWKEKLHQLYLHLNPKGHIESFGNALNSAQILEIIHLVKNTHSDTANRRKLSSLFAGITPFVFRELLSEASHEDLSILREEALTEAVQHNLSLLVSELDSQFTNFCNTLTTKENEINSLDLTTMGKDEITTLYRSIDKVFEEGNNILHLANRALAIAWNANRSDLIQELGRIKELCQKYLFETAGKPSSEEAPATGFFNLLDKKVDAIFSDQDANGNVNIMKDSTPALEGLVKFSVWYIQDYVQVGLLPRINLIEDADSKHENDTLKQREKLFLTAEENLNKIGLKTLADLKSARIYSKKALMEHINACQLTD